MLADKMRSVLDTQAEVCTAGDSSCLMHIGGGLSRLRAGTRTVHLAEILASVPQTAVPQTAVPQAAVPQTAVPQTSAPHRRDAR
jgi:L-lactate dehydrogenase complex protein LldE